MNIASIISKDCAISPPKEYASFDKKLNQFLAYINLERVFEKTLLQFHPTIQKLDVLDIPTFLGLEIEVENVHQEFTLPEFWKSKTDGSLRDGGKEFITIPLSPKQTILAIIALWLFMESFSKGKKPEFSWRTSNHVHLNVLDLTEEEFRCFLLLGTLFEPILFSIAGKDRANSVFCVPLIESSVRNSLGNYLRKKESFRDLATKWPKYTAINLCRLYTYPFISNPNASDSDLHSNHIAPALGTVEFRHLGGTPNPLILIHWVALLLRLFRASITTSVDALKEEIYSINSESRYQQMARRVLGTCPPQVPHCLMATAMVKEMFLSSPKLRSVAKPRSALHLYVHKQITQIKKTKPKTPQEVLEQANPMMTSPNLSAFTIISFDE